MLTSKKGTIRTVWSHSSKGVVWMMVSQESHEDTCKLQLLKRENVGNTKRYTIHNTWFSFVWLLFLTSTSTSFQVHGAHLALNRLVWVLWSYIQYYVLPNCVLRECRLLNLPLYFKLDRIPYTWNLYAAFNLMLRKTVKLKTTTILCVCIRV